MKAMIVYILLFYCAVAAAYGPKTLVLMDTYVTMETHSMFFASLKDRGFALTYKLSDDSNLLLVRYGEISYDNLILFTPNVEEFGGSVDVPRMLQFIDLGGNVFVATGYETSDVLRELGAECGIEVDVKGYKATDHFHGIDRCTLLRIEPDNVVRAPVIAGNPSGPILYEGAGLLANDSNPLVLKVLKGYATTYSYAPYQTLEKVPAIAGTRMALIAATQARNNARILFSGSIQVFSDEAFRTTLPDGKKTGNRELALALTRWTFGERGVLRVKSVWHRKSGEETAKESPTEYTIMDEAVFGMEVEEMVGNEWRPYNADDFQLEFVRIDPFVRINVPRVGNGKYEVRFRLPDIYGVFKFKVDYRRMGYTPIYSSTQVSVRPLLHTQYERFIESAYPYYVSAFSMMLGVFLFSIVFLHTDTGVKLKAA